MSSGLPGVLATKEARAKIELSDEELAALQEPADADVASVPAGEEPDSAPDEGAPAADDGVAGGDVPASKAAKVVAGAKAPVKAAPRALTAENTPDAVALAQAAMLWPDKEFKDGDAARASLNGLLTGNAGRAKRLAEVEAENERFRLAEETRAARTAAEAPPETGSGKGATAPPVKAGAEAPAAADEAEALEFVKSLDWDQVDRWFDGDVPKGFDATDGRRLALGLIAKQLAKFEHGKRLGLVETVKAAVLAEVESKYGERVKLAEAPALQQKEMLDAAKTFYDFYQKNMDDVTGSSLYPELEDPVANKEVIRIWADELGKKRTDEAIEVAVYRFRSRNPDWAPAAEEGDADDGGSPSTAEEPETAGKGRKARGAISGTGVPGAGLPARKAAEPGEMKEDAEAERYARERKNFGFDTRPRARAG